VQLELGDLKKKIADKMVFWNLRAAQGYLAHCAVHFSSSKSSLCELRVARGMWRGAPLNQEHLGIYSGSCASRRMMWRGAQLENSKKKGITVTCASRRTGGAARKHGNL
ncbi:hypothetical protein A2U01_0021982, partial [Trifolium medium]|nr:hypothetical protein [Trifolium medium]